MQGNYAGTSVENSGNKTRFILNKISTTTEFRIQGSTFLFELTSWKFILSQPCVG